jgi:hypothetical protein
MPWWGWLVISLLGTSLTAVLILAAWFLHDLSKGMRG